MGRWHTDPAMKMTPVRSSALAVLFVLGACSSEPDGPVKAADKPKDPEPIKRIELLEEPEEDVFKTTKSTAEYPELQITILKQGEGDESLTFGKIGMFHLVGKLATGKEFKNTRKSKSLQEVIMMEWGDLQGLVLGAVGMKKGEIRNMVIPPGLAYGKRGSRLEGVPANATIFLHVELTEIKTGLDSAFKVRRMAAGVGGPIRIGEMGSFRYTGVLAEGDRQGEQIGSNRLLGDPLFPMHVGGIGRAIEGRRKGAIGMRVGEKRWLWIPAKMAHGAQGQDKIPPDAALVFEIELVSIQD